MSDDVPTTIASCWGELNLESEVFKNARNKFLKLPRVEFVELLRMLLEVLLNFVIDRCDDECCRILLIGFSFRFDIELLLKGSGYLDTDGCFIQLCLSILMGG